ncbi:DNA double-strand break repair protein Rad50, partial [Rhus yellows phytoplasma]|uniref:DNA double-strand break repair protein Rad50 n=2 Tax=16SrI (Aster yellows group) TaxID=3042590 RepID=UPI0030D9009B
MKQPNFFQKHLVTIIIILLFGIAIIIGIHQGFNDYKNEKNSFSPLGQTPKKDSLEPETTPTPSRSKRSTEKPPQPKIKTTAARLEQIKTYLFTEPTDTSKLPSDLSEREQEEINKLKNSWKLSLGLLNEEKSVINQYQKTCDEHQSHLNSIQPQIENLKPQQQELQKLLDEKKQEIDRLKINKKENRAEIKKLQDETLEIAAEMDKISIKIKKLESKQEYYQDMLSRAQKYKKSLEEQYEDLTEGDKKLFNQIKSVEERRDEIQKEIDAVKEKLKAIETERDLYKDLKLKYEEMYNRALTYEKENEASLGNIVKWGFKAFDKVTDLVPSKYGMKIIGKTATFTRSFAQGMSKTTLVLHEGHRLWHMYNEVANENKEHPPMITKEALEMYTQDINRELGKLDADYKDYETKLGG